MNQNIPSSVKRAAARFHKERARYYRNLADRIKASNGQVKPLEIFSRDAVRFEGTARGVLSAFWVDRMAQNGANLADTWEGTLPDDEVAIIHVSQDAGAGALQAAMGDLARIAALSDRVKKEIRGTLLAALIGVVLATVMLTAFPIFAAMKFKEIFSFIPTESWGKHGRFLLDYVDGLKSFGWIVAGVVFLVISWIAWSFNNWTGPGRDWCDRKIVLWRVVRDIKGALFLSTMATLTRKRGNTSFTLRQSLATFAANARSPWLAWRVKEILDRVENTGGTSSDALDTSLLSRDVFYFLRDTQESSGFAEGFQATGKYIEEVLIDDLARRLTVYRWALLAVAVAIVIGVFAKNMAVIYEMKTVMMDFFSGR